ncbi:hypothetical protein A2U01_0044984, partial [Trifolium medium]|nr:hypothetical protein [Trifolium medium]
SQHVMGLNGAAVWAKSSADLSSSNVTWPLFGLPVGYTPSGYRHPSNEGSAAAKVNQVPMGTNTEFLASQPRARQVLPRATVPQESLGDPRNANKGSRMQNVGPGANSAIPQIGETHKKIRAIEDKLRVMESFLLSNVYSVHPYTSMPVHTPYSQHLYQTAVQCQQPQGFLN